MQAAIRESMDAGVCSAPLNESNVCISNAHDTIVSYESSASVGNENNDLVMDPEKAASPANCE